jgi:hypothetical protein
MNKAGSQPWDRVISQKYTLISVVILLIASVLRFYDLGGSSLWVDEAVYANGSMTDFWSFIDNTRAKNSSPIILPYIYYLLGEEIRDTFLIRLPPAIFSLLSVAVILLLPKAGVSRAVAVLTAFVLAVAPIQIFYAQEVREYSLSVLISSVIIFAFSGVIYKRTRAWVLLFSATLFVAPLASYGNIFIALAMTITFLAINTRDRQFDLSIALLPLLALLTGITITYQVTASYQLYVVTQEYLYSFFPPADMWDKLSWVATCTLGWLGLVFGRQVAQSFPAIVMVGIPVAILILMGVVWELKRKTGNKFQNLHLFVVLVILLGGAIVASIIGVFPFGGLRQHLYAAPLITLCASQSIISLNAFGKGRSALIALLTGIIIFSTASFIQIPKQYREIQDIVSVISLGLGEVSDESVYIYYGANPAVDFHYPKRPFFRGTWARDHVDVMGDEIIEQIHDCHVSVVFSHVWKSEDAKILTYLEESGLQSVEDHRYAGARVVKLRQPGLNEGSQEGCEGK